MCVHSQKNIAWLSYHCWKVGFISSWLYDHTNSRQREMIVYQGDRKSYLQFTQGEGAVLADKEPLANKSSMQFNITRNIYDSGIINVEQLNRNR
jgi:hypothetical protein